MPSNGSYVTPGLYYEIVDTVRNDIDPTRVDIPAFLGIASQGPVDQAIQINSQAQFQANFGSFTATSYLAYSIRAFFENGGSRCYVVRVASPSAHAATVMLQDGMGKDTLRITANGPGVWGNNLTVVLAGTNSFATQTTTDVQHPPFLSKDNMFAGVFVDSMVGFTPGTLVNVFQPQVSRQAYIIVTLPPPEQVIVPGQKILYWNDQLTPLNEPNLPQGKQFDLNKTLWLETVEFSMSVYLSGQLRETFTRLSFSIDSPYYVENAISAATSLLIRVQDTQKDDPAPTSQQQRFPAMKNGTASVTLSGGKDGLTDMQVGDFTGDPSAVEKRGLRVLEDVSEVATIAIPDLTLPPTQAVQKLTPSSPDQCLPGVKTAPRTGTSITTIQPGEQFTGFSLDDIARVQQVMIDFCEAQKRCMALLDPPVQPTGKVFSIGDILNWRQQFDSKYAALYYPQLLVYDPLKLGGRIVRAIPPSGHVAGMFARVDTETGVHQAPANEELNWAQGLSLDITGPMQGMLNPYGINCIRTFAGRGIRIYGARTLSSDPSWRYVNVRRLFIMLERSLEAAMQWTVFEPNNFALHQTLVATISTFLESLWLKGAFAGAKASDAFFVKIDDQNNPPELADQGQLLVEVGVAPVIPAEFVIFRIGLALDQLNITEQSSSS